MKSRHPLARLSLKQIHEVLEKHRSWLICFSASACQRYVVLWTLEGHILILDSHGLAMLL